MGKSSGGNRQGGGDEKTRRQGREQAKKMDETDLLLWYEKGKAQASARGTAMTSMDKMRNKIIDEEIKRRGLSKPKIIRSARVVDLIITLRNNPQFAQRYASDIEKGLISSDGKQAYAAYLMLKKKR